MTSSMICGHDREALIWALQCPSDCVIFPRPWTDESVNRHAAMIAIHDPAWLATVIAELIRERGIQAYVFAYGAKATTAPVLPEDAVVIYYDTDKGGIVQIYPPRMPHSRVLILHQARDLSRTLLSMPTATIDDINRMICDFA